MSDAQELAMKRSLEALACDFGSELLKYFKDEDVMEMEVNPDGKLFVNTYSRGQYETNIVVPRAQRESINRQVAAIAGTICDENNPSVAAELPDTDIFAKSRFQGMLPPCVSSPMFVIRKHTEHIFTLEDYFRQGVINAQQLDLIKKLINEKKNIIVAGATSSGKTTFVNGLLAEISKQHSRVILIEDTPELKCSAANYVSLRTCKAKTMTDLVTDTLRLTPNRIIVGEVRDGAALALMTAWSTGHKGGCSTVHANSAHDTLIRLEDMISQVSQKPLQRTIVNAVDAIIYIMFDEETNRRKIPEIVSVDDYDFEQRKYITHKIG